MSTVKYTKIHKDIVRGCEILNCDPWAIIIYNGNYRKWRGQAFLEDISKAFNNRIDIQKCVIPVRADWISDMKYTALTKMDRMKLIPLLVQKMNRLLRDRRNHIQNNSHIRHE